MRAVIEAAGFTGVDFSARRWRAFDGAPTESSATKYGTEGVAIFAVKPIGPLPEANAVLDVPGQACATLTPLIKQHLRGLAGGRVLEVRADDPAAREGVPAWSRLTGNALVATVVEDTRRTRFFIRKKDTGDG